MLSNASRYQRIWLIVLFAVWIGSNATESLAQRSDAKQNLASPSESAPVDQAMLQNLANAARAPKVSQAVDSTPGIDFLSLLVKGGVFMIPIGLVSLVALMFIFERLIGLRTGRLLPRQFVRKMVQLSRESTSLDPREVYKLCMNYPSAASHVVQAALLRVGRPQQEVQSAATEANQREADKAYSGVRWLQFAAGVAPLLGLIGTVWGLIRAFHDLTLLGPSQNRADFLGRGIYEALVTTLAGLVVAIPAAVAAHYFEGRIHRVFRNIEELVFSLVPKFERFEGRVRFDEIGRELAARNIEIPKKPSSVNVEESKVHAVPPVQAPATAPGQLYVPPSGPARKSIYKP
ncbi:MAG: MotA/TolQ/ExbB proton channel family protein [Pirellulaceae bacterium]|nr:MotA/TolQ/ExbB proton channel family protein [Pirellulaceae bacterium]